MEKNRRNYDASEDYNDLYNPGENFDTEAGYDNLEDKWYEIEDEYRAAYPDVTDEDVSYDNGRFIDMLDNIGRRRGRTGREIRTEIENW